MPIYEYQCKKCSEVFEILHGFNEEPPKKCEECGGKLEKLISLSAFHLKGSGWYETDYGKKKVSHEKELKNNTDTAAPATSDSSSSDKPVDTGGAHTANEAKSTLDSIKSDTSKAKKSSKES